MWRSYFCALVATAVLAVSYTDGKTIHFALMKAGLGNESFSNRSASHVRGQV